LHATGEPIEIGPIEKMSKSKRNTVDPDEIIAAFGADTARWFMLSDSPPDRDVIWTEEGVKGASRFVQRVWRLVASGQAARRRTAALTSRATPRHSAKPPTARSPSVEDNIAAIRFNVAVAKIYELTNAIAAAVCKSDKDAALRRAIAPNHRGNSSLLVQMMAPMMPHLAEECWKALGHKELVATAPWPKFEPSLLVEDMITLPVQVNGKKRSELTIAVDASQADVERATLALEAVRRALGGNSPKKIVVVPKRIVNVVV
jgi:leucyl-tRNA synthetase